MAVWPDGDRWAIPARRADAAGDPPSTNSCPPSLSDKDGGQLFLKVFPQRGKILLTMNRKPAGGGRALQILQISMPDQPIDSADVEANMSFLKEQMASYAVGGTDKQAMEAAKLAWLAKATWRTKNNRVCRKGVDDNRCGNI